MVETYQRAQDNMYCLCYTILDEGIYNQQDQVTYVMTYMPAYVPAYVT